MTYHLTNDAESGVAMLVLFVAYFVVFLVADWRMRKGKS